MYKILLMGPQGSGKGTQAEILSKELGIPTFSMGQIFRDEIAEQTDRGKELDRILSAGELVPDQLALEMMFNRIREERAEDGYILDGYPRNAAQADAYATMDTPTHVVIIDVPRDESLARLFKRAELEGRKDDSKEAIERRLAIYEENTKPLVDRYQNSGSIHMINGVGTVEEVADRIRAVFN